MVFFAQSQDTESTTSSNNITPGVDQFFAELENNLQPGQGFPGVEPQMTPWEELLEHFATPRRTTPLPTGLRDPSGRAPTDFTEQRESAADQLQVQQDRQRLIRLAREAGVDTSNPAALADLWASAIQEAEAAYTVDPRPGQEIDLVWEVLERWTETGAPGTLKFEESEQRRRDEYFAEEGDPYTETRVDERINVTDPDTAETVFREALRRRIGKDPTEEQLRSGIAALNAKERSNPQRTTTVTNYAADGRVLGTESTTEGGGVEPAGFAMESFQEEELEGEERAYIAGVEYAPVIDRLVGGF